METCFQDKLGPQAALGLEADGSEAVNEERDGVGEKQQSQSRRPHSCGSFPPNPLPSLSEWRAAEHKAGSQDAAPRLEANLKSVVGRTGPLSVQTVSV